MSETAIALQADTLIIGTTGDHPVIHSLQSTGVDGLAVKPDFTTDTTHLPTILPGRYDFASALTHPFT